MSDEEELEAIRRRKLEQMQQQAIQQQSAQQQQQQIELQLIQLFQSGKLRGATPLPDKEFKKILEKITAGSKKEFNIKK